MVEGTHPESVEGNTASAWDTLLGTQNGNEDA